jgi:hypothetical protein
MWIMFRESARTEQKTLPDSVEYNKPVNILQRNNPCLFWKPYKTRKCT